jgi:hypothetical protein
MTNKLKWLYKACIFSGAKAVSLVAYEDLAIMKLFVTNVGTKQSRAIFVGIFCSLSNIFK